VSQIGWYLEQPRTEIQLITAWHDNKGEVRFAYQWPEPSLIKRNTKMHTGRKIRPSSWGGGKMQHRLLLFSLLNVGSFFHTDKDVQLESINSFLNNI